MSFLRSAAKVPGEDVQSFNIRDIPASILAAIDRHAKKVKQSRQQYLSSLLEHTFGPQENTTTAIAFRLKQSLRSVNQLTYWDRKPTLAAIAEGLQHSSTQFLESAINGDEPLPFAQADQLCTLLGISREWLLDGSLHPFYQSPKYPFPRDLLVALGRDELRNHLGGTYNRLNLVLSADRARIAIYGRSSSLPWRQDKLIDSHLSEWDVTLLCTCLNYGFPASLLLHIPEQCMSLILSEQDFQSLTNGELHPDYYAPSTIFYHQWHLAFEDFEPLERRSMDVTPSLIKARDKFLQSLKESKLANKASLTLYIQEQLDRSNAVHPPAPNASQFLTLRTRAEDDEPLLSWLEEFWRKYSEPSRYSFNRA